MATFPGRGNDLRKWALDDHRNRELASIYKKEQKILAEMEAVVAQGESEAKSFKEMMQRSKEKRVVSGRDVTADKLSQRLAETVEVSGWDGVAEHTKTKAQKADDDRLEGNLDKQIRESWKEQEVACGHPDCDKQVRAADGYCSRVHETQHLSMQHIRDVSKPDKEEPLPTYNDIKFGRAPMRKQDRQAQVARAKAKGKILDGREGQ